MPKHPPTSSAYGARDGQGLANRREQLSRPRPVIVPRGRSKDRSQITSGCSPRWTDLRLNEIRLGDSMAVMMSLICKAFPGHFHVRFKGLTPCLHHGFMFDGFPSRHVGQFCTVCKLNSGAEEPRSSGIIGL